MLSEVEAPLTGGLGAQVPAERFLDSAVLRSE